MESRESTIYGRRTFFLNPTMQIERMVIPRLRNLEYEVYVIKNYQDAKAVLREYKDSLCFINIDDQLTFPKWFNFIKSFEFDETLSSTFLGVLSAKAKKNDKEQFLMKAKLPGGFVDLSDKNELLQQNLEKILDLNGAKGRRQYVRLEKKMLGNQPSTCFINEKMITFHLMDLSAAGFAATTSPANMQLFRKGLFVANIAIKFGQKTFYIDAEIFASQLRGNDCVVVFLFPPITPPKKIEEVRTFVHQTLQESINSFIESSIKDLTDYSKEILPPASKSGAPSLDDLKFEDLGDLEAFDPSMDA